VTLHPDAMKPTDTHAAEEEEEIEILHRQLSGALGLPPTTSWSDAVKAAREAANEAKAADLHRGLNRRTAEALGLTEPRPDPETGESYLPSWHDMPERVAALVEAAAVGRDDLMDVHLRETRRLAVVLGLPAGEVRELREVVDVVVRRLGAPPVAWCPDCGEVNTCDEDRCCSTCGLDLVVYADRGAAEVGRKEVDGLRSRLASLSRALTHVLDHLTQAGHPGQGCLRTGWIRAEVVGAWRAVLNGDGDGGEG
jgi:hypothetical protein